MLPSCGQLMVLVIVGGQIWFKNLVKIWSGSGCGKSGSAQNLVRRKIWFDGKSGSRGLIRAVSSCEQVFRTGVRKLPECIRTSVLNLEIDTPKKSFSKGCCGSCKGATFITGKPPTTIREGIKK